MKSNTNIQAARIIQFCTFKLSGHLFGVNILDVKEVNPGNVFSPIFHAPKTVKGYMNIRGRIHLVLDLRMIFGFESSPDNNGMVVLFKPSVAEPFGVLVDKIGDVIVVTSSQIEETGSGIAGISEEIESGTSEFVSGICKLDSDLLVIIEPGKLLNNLI